MQDRKLIITALAITFLGSLYLVQRPSVRNYTMSAPGPTALQGVPGLSFKLSQISKNPPSLLVTLKNDHPTSTFTILKWGTPLDSHAANLGVFKFIDVESGEELKTDKLMIRRKMPITPAELQEIAPATEHATEVVFSQPWMPTKPAKYKVRAEGSFQGVWEKVVDEVEQSELDAYTASAYNDCPFVSEEELLVVE